MLNFMIVVDDGGELKSVTAADIDAHCEKGLSTLPQLLQQILNEILDDRAIAAGEYDPSDNDTPFTVTCSAWEGK